MLAGIVWDMSWRDLEAAPHSLVGLAVLVEHRHGPSRERHRLAERCLLEVDRDLLVQLPLIVGVGTDPVGRLYSKLAVDGVLDDALDEVKDRFAPPCSTRQQEVARHN